MRDVEGCVDYVRVHYTNDSKVPLVKGAGERVNCDHLVNGHDDHHTGTIQMFGGYVHITW